MINAIVPNTIPAGGSQIAEIYGINFGTNPTVSATGGIAVTHLYKSPMQINVRFDAPITPPGSYNVMVTSNGLTGVFLQSPGGAPQSQPQSQSKPVSVTPPPQFTITTRAFIPVNHVGRDPISCPLDGVYHKGDDRTFSSSSAKYRVQQRVVYQAGSSPAISSHNKSVGETKVNAKNAVDNNGTLDAADDDATLNDCNLLHARGFASTVPMSDSLAPNGVRINGEGVSPLNLAAPGISWDYTVAFTVGPSGSSYNLTVTHDCFPAHEAYVGSQTMYTYAPSGYGFWSDIAWCLAGFDSITTVRTGAVTP